MHRLVSGNTNVYNINLICVFWPYYHSNKSSHTKFFVYYFQRDVSGTCDTTYTVAQQGWLSLTIKKSKDMSSCTDRHGYETAIQTTPFRISSVSNDYMGQVHKIMSTNCKTIFSCQAALTKVMSTCPQLI